MVIAEIGAGLTSLKAALELAKAINVVAGEAKLNDVKIGLQSNILDAQEALSNAREAHTADVDRIRNLEQELVRLKDWEADKQRYQLEEVVVGAFAYSPKPGMENGEPRHRLCANCFQQGEKSFLSRRPTNAREIYLMCPRCSASVMIAGVHRSFRPVRFRAFQTGGRDDRRAPRTLRRRAKSDAKASASIRVIDGASDANFVN